MDLHKTLLELEYELGHGNGDTYRRHLTDDAVVIVPGRVLSKDETVQAMDASPGWDGISFVDERLVELGDGSALLTYRFDGRRGDTAYAALMSSVYVQRAGTWKMAFHQQTPLA